MNMKKTLALLLAVIMLVGIMAACSPKAPVESEKPAESTAPEAAGLELSVCLASEPMTIDPTLNSAVDGAIMVQHFFEGLMKWADDGSGNAKLVPGQAESYDKVTNEDGTVTYTFKLRDGIKWSDGEPVTAGDFVYSWRRAVDPATAADYSNMFAPIVGAEAIYAGVPSGEFETVVDEETGTESKVEKRNHAAPDTLGVEAKDDKTLVVNLINDTPYFLELCAFATYLPIRSSSIEAAGDQWTFDTATYIGNGPYKMSEWVHNSFIKAVKSETYYDYAKLGPDSITFQLMDDTNAMYTAFKGGTLQFIEEAPIDEIPTLLADGSLTVVPYIGTYYVCFQTQKAPFNDPKVREAFSLAIDRNYIVENVTQTGQVPASGYVPSGINDAKGVEGDDFRTVGGDYYSVKAEDYEANCEKARALLAEAGYPEGKGFPVTEYLYNTNENHKAIGEALQNMWKTQLGVDVTLNNQEWAVFLSTRKEGNYGIARNGWIADYNDPMSFLDMWLTGGGNNDAQYTRPEYDAAIKKAYAATDPAERMKYMHEAEDMIIGEDNALAPIYFYTQKYMLDPSIKGMYYTPLGYFFFAYCTKEA